MTTQETVRRTWRLGLPHLPLMVGVFLASSLYSVLSAGLIWFLVNAFFAGSMPLDHLPSAVRQLLAPVDHSLRTLGTGSILAWGGAGIVAMAALAYARDMGSGLLVWRVVCGLRQSLCDRFLSLDLAFLQNRKAGDLLSRLNNDVAYAQSVVNFLFNDLLQHPVDILCGVGALVAMGYGKLTLGALVLLPLIAGPMRLLSKRIRKAAQKGAESLGEITQIGQEMLSGIRIVKAFRAEERERAAFAEANQRFFRKMMSIVRARAVSGALMDLIAYGGFAMLGGLLLATLSKSGALSGFSPIELGAFLLIGAQRILTPSRALVKAMNNLHASLPGAARVFELLDAAPAVRDGSVPLPPLEREIAFEGVTFAYESEPVLRGVDLKVRKGWLVAVVGPSGAGKSTLLSLLPRFYDPTSGRVAIDGTDLRTATLDSLLGQVAVVTQDPFLFHTTLRENIAYGRPGATREEVEAAARAANIHDAILRLPKGYDTVVGERGLRLSGGERQRVAIARALLKDARILLLDEATSELDSASERAVQEALDRLMAGRTTLVIAHRLSTVLHADLIVVLERGRIAAQGTHAELLAQGGLYRSLYEMQFGGRGA